ncbi:RNA-binding protein [Dirofilaria immitis]
MLGWKDLLIYEFQNPSISNNSTMSVSVLFLILMITCIVHSQYYYPYSQYYYYPYSQYYYPYYYGYQYQPYYQYYYQLPPSTATTRTVTRDIGLSLPSLVNLNLVAQNFPILALIAAGIGGLVGLLGK